MQKTVAQIQLIQVMKLPVLLTMQAMKLQTLPTLLSQDQIILMSIVLLYLLSLSLVIVYFLHITRPRQK